MSQPLHYIPIRKCMIADLLYILSHTMNKILFILALLSANYSFAQTKIAGEKALEDLSNNKNIQLLDVRTSKEYDTKHLKDAINIDWKDQTTFEATVANLDKNKPLYVYCLGGGRSAAAAKKLTDLGYEVFDIEGGIMKWESNNLPLVKGVEGDKAKGMTIQEYTNIIQNNDIVLIDFHATWCPPCKKLAPIIENITKKYEGKVKVVKIDVDQNSQLTKSLGITSIPTLFVYKKGNKTWSHNNFVKQKTIEKQL